MSIKKARKIVPNPFLLSYFSHCFFLFALISVDLLIPVRVSSCFKVKCLSVRACHVRISIEPSSCFIMRRCRLRIQNKKASRDQRLAPMCEMNKIYRGRPPTMI